MPACVTGRDDGITHVKLLHLQVFDIADTIFCKEWMDVVVDVFEIGSNLQGSISPVDQEVTLDAELALCDSAD